MLIENLRKERDSEIRLEKDFDIHKHIVVMDYHSDLIYGLESNL